MEKLSNVENLFFETSNDLAKKMKDAYLACPTAVKYCHDIGLTDEMIDKNIDIIYAFVRDINYCRKCPGKDKCDKTNPHLCTKIVNNYGFIDRQLTPCKEMLKMTQFQGQFALRDFDEKWLNSTLKDIDQTKERKAVVAQYVKYIKENNTDWIYIMGEQNTGRSYLAATLCTDLASKGKGPIVFANTSLRFRMIADIGYKNQEKFQNAINEYCTCPVLVLDDFGNEFKNDFVRDSILFEILNKRSANHLLTIFTSDFSIEDVVTLYSGKDKASALRATQIGKLLMNCCKREFSLGDISVY